MTPSSKKFLYEDAKSRWPMHFKILDKDKHSRTIYTDPPHFTAFEKIDESINNEDHWKKISTWAFYQALFIKIEWSYNRSVSIISKDDISFRDFDRQLCINLDDESWKEERFIYNALPEG